MAGELTGKKLGQYELRGQIGRGGMAAVYQAYQTNIKREVAIKILPPYLTEKAGYLERFEREVQITASLEHPAILPIYDYGTEDGVTYIVMRLMPGGSLSARLAKLGKPSAGEALQLLKQIAGGLDYAHKRGVVHLDLKPGNILFDAEGNPYLSDFGLSELMASGTEVITAEALAGTPAYLSPEQAQGKAVDERADLYALGVIAYELLTGKLPFEGKNALSVIVQQVQAPVPKADLPDTVYDVLAKALAKNPNERYSTANEFIHALRGAMNFAFGEDLQAETGFLTTPVWLDGAPEPIEDETGELPRFDEQEGEEDTALHQPETGGVLTPDRLKELLRHYQQPTQQPVPSAPSIEPQPIPAPAAYSPSRMPAAPQYAPPKLGSLALPLVVFAVLGLIAFLLIAWLSSRISTAVPETSPIGVGILLAFVLVIGGGAVAAAVIRAAPRRQTTPISSVTDAKKSTITIESIRDEPTPASTAAPVGTVAPMPPDATSTGKGSKESKRGAPAISYHTLKPGDMLRGYRIEARLDKGDRSRVFHAYDIQRERDVAIKCMNAEFDTATRTARFKREAQLLGRLHHAHIVPFFDYDSINDMNYIVMPLLKGRSLAHRLETKGRLLLPEVLELLDQLAGGLDYMHGKGIIHRDLKPNNLVFDDQDNIYLADLGIAKVLDDADSVHLTQAGQPLGTPAYMPPEQWSGEPVTPAADQYALACIVFQLLTGELPFTGDTPFALMLKHVRDTPPLLSQLRPDLPPALDAALLKALEKNPADRYPSVRDFANALKQAAYAQPQAEIPQKKVRHVFISYSRADGDYAYKLADHLRRQGFEVWIDSRIEPSDSWWRSIVDAIDGCGAFVVIMTPAAEESKWVEREVMLADQKGKPAFPLLLKGQPFPIYVSTQHTPVIGEQMPPETFISRLRDAVGKI